MLRIEEEGVETETMLKKRRRLMMRRRETNEDEVMHK